MVYDIRRAARAPADPRLTRLVETLGTCPAGQALLVEAAAHNIQTGPRMGLNPILFSPNDRGVAVDIQQLAYQLERVKNPGLLRAETDYAARFREVSLTADRRATAIAQELGVSPVFNVQGAAPAQPAPKPREVARVRTPALV